jgi:hypothetical protein
MSPTSTTLHSRLKRDWGFPGTFKSRHSPQVIVRKTPRQALVSPPVGPDKRMSFGAVARAIGPASILLRAPDVPAG